MIHHYLFTIAAPEHHEQLNRELTGELGTYRTTPQPEAEPALPKPPSWVRIRPADIARMAQARQAIAD